MPLIPYTLIQPFLSTDVVRTPPLDHPWIDTNHQQIDVVRATDAVMLIEFPLYLVDTDTIPRWLEPNFLRTANVNRMLSETCVPFSKPLPVPIPDIVDFDVNDQPYYRHTSIDIMGHNYSARRLDRIWAWHNAYRLLQAGGAIPSGRDPGPLVTVCVDTGDSAYLRIVSGPATILLRSLTTLAPIAS